MGILGAFFSIALMLFIFLDGFEAIVLPRRVTRPYRFARFFYRNTWLLWRQLARCLPAGKHRENFLSIFGPLSLLALFTTWICVLIFAFGLLHLSLDTRLSGSYGKDAHLGTYLYLSGTTFFTLGYGDVTPEGAVGRILAVAEAGLGFGFLAIVISYLPVLYQAFSRREVPISLMDARAGSPPSAGQLLVRLARAHKLGAIHPILVEWERWAAEVLESHLSYPVLSYYRSQHDNQSWLAALTTVLDTCAILIALVKEIDSYQAQLTFAMSRHAAVDLALIFKTMPKDLDRLSEEQCQRLREALTSAGVRLREGPEVGQRLAELMAMYEPFVNALAQHFLLQVPCLFPEQTTIDNWQTSAWTRRTPGIGDLPVPAKKDDHFV
jgi:hypothetical protein